MTFRDTNIHIGLAGDGRLAKQLKALLDALSLPYSRFSRSENTPEEIQNYLQKSTHIWLAISDSAIESFYQSYAKSTVKSAKVNPTWVHFSGAHNSKYIYSAHPLMTFSNTLLSVSEWENVHFVVSPPASEENRTDLTLSDLLPGVANSWSYLPAEKKAFYHALCVIAGNFPIILWSEVLVQFQKLSLPKEALDVYLDRIILNFKNEGAAALTGPIVRKDIKTIEENMKSLEASSLKDIYEAFTKHKGIKL